jgi:hypothetical protein
MDAELIARSFHEAYERLAPRFGYHTRPDSAVPWADLPAQNKSLMLAVVQELIERGVIICPSTPNANDDD